MGKKLKVPAGGVAGKKQQPAAESQETAPAQPTVAGQATALLEADETPDSIPVTDDNLDAPDGAVVDGYERSGDTWVKQPDDQPAVAAAEPEIADADVPVSPSMEEPSCTACGAKTSHVPCPNCGFAEMPSPPTDTPVTLNEIPTEQRDAYGEALQKHWSAVYKWERDVEAAKEKHTTSAIVRSQADDARKVAKKHEDDALDFLVTLLDNKPIEPTFAEVVAELARKRPAAVASDRPSDAPAAPANTSDAWRAVPITKLDLPEKLIERLQEAGLDTMGRLEDRRAEIALGKEKWPKGIGEAKITKIEDAVVAWLTANRDQAAFGELQSGHASEPAAEGEAKGEGETTANPVAHTDQPEVGTEAYADAINARAASFDVDDMEAMQDKTGGGYWEQGFDHFDAGGELRTCELPSGSPAQDDFIRGWLRAGNLKDREDAGLANNFDEEPPAGEEPELQEAGGDVDEASAGPVLFNPDDI